MQYPYKDGTRRKKTKATEKIKSFNLADNDLVLEDEKKFQEYFLKEKHKTLGSVYVSPVKDLFELSINQEIIEQHQELIIEKEELVPRFQYPKEKKIKEEKTRRWIKSLQIKKDKSSLMLYKINSHLGKWFNQRKQPVGLKGGADREKAETEKQRCLSTVNRETGKEV